MKMHTASTLNKIQEKAATNEKLRDRKTLGIQYKYKYERTNGAPTGQRPLGTDMDITNFK